LFNNIENRNTKKGIRRIKRKIRRLKWFPNYQSFTELGIKGRRNDSIRYKYLDLSLCRNKIVVDYGCNLGQASIKAAKAGAKHVIGLDSQEDTITVALKIKEILNVKNVDFYTVDFNQDGYEKRIKTIFNNKKPAISFFLSVYRTKELKDRDGLFQFIIDNTEEIIYFEGHSDRSIDTVEYYMDLFKRFGLNSEFLGYSQKDTRPFFIIRVNR